MFSLKHVAVVIFTLAMMLGTYLLIEDITGLATPIALFILFIDEVLILFLGVIGWRVDQLKDWFKR